MDNSLAQEQGKNREMVGYGHPPQATRFQPGRSGNPAGRPKGRSITALLRQAVQVEVEGRTVAERIAEVMIGLALRGDIRFIKEVLDRVDGKAPREIPGQHSEISRIEIVYPSDSPDRSRGSESSADERAGWSSCDEVPDADMEAVAEGEATLMIEGKAYRGVDIQALG